MSYEKDISWVDSAAAKRIVNRCVKLFCVNQPKLIAVIFDRGGGVHPPYSPPHHRSWGEGTRSRDLLKEHQVRPWRGGYSVNNQHVCHVVDHGRCVPEQNYLQYLQRTRASFTSLGFATLEPVQHSSYCHTQASRKLGII